MKNNIITILTILVVLIITTTRCQYSNPLDVDISKINVNIEVNRMEQDLFDKEEKDLSTLNKKLIKKYGYLYEIFVSKMIVEGSVYDPSIDVRLKRFRNDTIIISIYEDIKNKFYNFDKYIKGFNKAFSYYKYYFPDSTLPNITTFYSNFNAKIFPTNSSLAIGLDMYLGTNNKKVMQIPTEILPQFIKEDMKERYMVADGMKYWLLNRFYDENIGDDFISKIIELGKIMYLLDAIMPNTPDDIKINYTPEELKWVENNETNIWKSLVDNNIIYSKNPMTINQYISDGPFTKGLPKESPSKVGIWVGWQIVKDYVSENNISVLSLIEEKNTIKILKSYKHGNR